MALCNPDRAVFFSWFEIAMKLFGRRETCFLSKLIRPNKRKFENCIPALYRVCANSFLSTVLSTVESTWWLFALSNFTKSDHFPKLCWWFSCKTISQVSINYISFLITVTKKFWGHASCCWNWNPLTSLTIDLGKKDNVWLFAHWNSFVV